MIDIRSLKPSDVIHLESQPFPHAPKHHDRLARQQQGDVVYLIAWIDGLPVGHLLLKWGGTTDPPMADVLAQCPDIEDLFVLPDYRQRGIATRLMDAAEALASQNGYPLVGLGAGAEETDIARQMYERRGYADAGFGEYVESGTAFDQAGREFRWEARCLYLIKTLHADRTSP